MPGLAFPQGVLRKPFIDMPHWTAPMAEGEGAEFQRQLAFSLSVVLLVAGLLLYWYWGLRYGTWSPFTRGNIGIYTIYTPLIAFGIIGILLYRKKPAPETH